MQLHRLENRAASGAACLASAWPQGAVATGDFCARNERGEAVPLQSRITAYWPDGSVKWAAHTAFAGQLGAQCTVEPGTPAAPERPLQIIETPEGWQVGTGCLSVQIPRSGEVLHGLCGEGAPLSAAAVPVFWLERRTAAEGEQTTVRRFYRGQISKTVLEQAGPLEAVFRMEGVHIPDEAAGCTMPFVLRMQLLAGSAEIHFTHTFFYDGEAARDFLGGMGLRFELSLGGAAQDRQLKFGIDAARAFHEGVVLLPEQAQQNPGLRRKLANWREAPLPVWRHYRLTQLNERSFVLQKGTGEGCCLLDSWRGSRAPGTAALAGPNGTLCVAMRDFWQKHPAGLEAEALDADRSACTAWFYSPAVPAYDFRHYDTRSYPDTLYEGFAWSDPDPKGIAVSSECSVLLAAALPEDAQLDAFHQRTQHPAVYTAAPQAYHDAQVFGAWSLPHTGTQPAQWLETQLDAFFRFYQGEVERRSWYGLFDYGDIMHSYDIARHCWRYDMGGYAWQNTELVPTYWLWLYFLRTGRSDVFDFAEAMTRHCADVDFYHFGPKKGIGTRHNVRHWGCACKEPRVAMAGHHRFYYYLTGNRRIGDAMEDAKDADLSMKNLRYFSQSGELRVRSGPDWSSFASNWFTHYERTQEPAYRAKLERGIADLAAAPLRLASGPDFTYDEATGALGYCGENDRAPNMHLQVCQGGSEVWIELASALPSPALAEMLAEYGRFYFLSPEEKRRESGGLIQDRPFSYPYFAAALGAYAAKARGDRALARTVWAHLFHALVSGQDDAGVAPSSWTTRADGTPMLELPWISTNFASQWCLNVIVALDLIGDALPATWEELRRMIDTDKNEEFHSA